MGHTTGEEEEEEEEEKAPARTVPSIAPVEALRVNPAGNP